MFKRTLRWLMPLIALLMVAACLAFSPILSSHAASITPGTPAIQTHTIAGPNILRFGK